MTTPRPPERRNFRRTNAVVAALKRLRAVFLSVGLFSGVLNVLALTGSFYMLQVYDRVLPSQSVPTLMALTGLLFGLYLFYGLLDAIRMRIMSRIGNRIDSEITEKVFATIPQLNLRARQSGDGLQPMRDLDHMRGFLCSVGPTALFDLPWLPFFLFIVYLLHPWLGIFATIAAALLALATLYTETRSREPNRRVVSTGAERASLAQAAHRNAEAIKAMGFQDNINRRWRDINAAHTSAQLAAADVVGGMGSLTRVMRFAAQSGILGLGAYLVILQEVSPGTIIAASITMSRALAPIETAIAHWRGFIAARQGYARLKELFTLLPGAGHDVDPLVALPAPKQSLQVAELTLAPPGETKPTLMRVSFDLEAGDGLGVIGPSGAGKSTLARGLVDVWAPAGPNGSVRLDGAELKQYAPDALGRAIGYMPQEITLFKGTIAENISRFDPEMDDHAVIKAGLLAGAHDMIVRLAHGYQTEVGDNGQGLSVGQRQRIALARALYRDPFLVVLDEPNANLDADGEVCLTAAIKSIRDRGGIAIVIAHRPAAIAAVNKVLAIKDGQLKAFGPKDEVLKTVLTAASVTSTAPVTSPEARQSSTQPSARRAGQRGQSAEPGQSAQRGQSSQSRQSSLSGHQTANTGLATVDERKTPA